METEITLGVMVYVDNHPRMLEEFQWIYKSWIFSGNWTTSDLIVVHHPDVAHALPLHEEGIVGVPCLPVSGPASVFERHHFVNSIACLSGPHVDDVALRYPYLLRTDADVFLTEHLVAFRPSYPVHGFGSLLAEASLVVRFLKRQTQWCQMMLRDFGHDAANWGETWGCWYRGLSTLYTAEIAARPAGNDFLLPGRERILDVESSCDRRIDSLVFHIHAVHTDDYFSKFAFRAGKYGRVDTSALDLNRINQYCHWLAVTSTDKVKRLANYPE